MKDKPDISDIGLGLVATSRKLERTPGELLGELFPYVYDASRRMSTRAISSWLKENHRLHISQPTISRALRNPAKYWEAFAEFIEPAARSVEAVGDATMQDFLFDERLFAHIVNQLPPLRLVPDESGEAKEFSDVEGAVGFLRQKWFSLNHQTRLHCRRYFNDADEREDGIEKKL